MALQAHMGGFSAQEHPLLQRTPVFGTEHTRFPWHLRYAAQLGVSEKQGRETIFHLNINHDEKSKQKMFQNIGHIHSHGKCGYSLQYLI